MIVSLIRDKTKILLVFNKKFLPLQKFCVLDHHWSMVDIVKDLLAYLAKTPREQQLRDWENLSAFGKIGPDVFEYLDYIHERMPEITISNYNVNPEFSLDFFV